MTKMLKSIQIALSAILSIVLNNPLANRISKNSDLTKPSSTGDAKPGATTMKKLIHVAKRTDNMIFLFGILCMYAVLIIMAHPWELAHMANLFLIWRILNQADELDDDFEEKLVEVALEQEKERRRRDRSCCPKRSRVSESPDHVVPTLELPPSSKNATTGINFNSPICEGLGDDSLVQNIVPQFACNVCSLAHTTIASRWEVDEAKSLLDGCIDRLNVLEKGTVRMGPQVCLAPTLSLLRLVENIKSRVDSDVVVFLDSGSPHSIVPQDLLTDKFKDFFGVSEVKELGWSVKSPLIMPISVKKRHWTPLSVCYGDEEKRMVLLQRYDGRRITLGRDTMETCGMCFEMEDEGSKVFLDTGSSVDVTSSKATHYLPEGYDLNGVRKFNVNICKGLLSVCLGGIDVRACSVAGIQEWPVRYCQIEDFVEGAASLDHREKKWPADVLNNWVCLMNNVQKNATNTTQKKKDWKQKVPGTDLTYGQRKDLRRGLKIADESLTRSQAKGGPAAQKFVSNLRAIEKTDVDRHEQKQPRLFAENFGAASFEMENLKKLANVQEISPSDFILMLSKFADGDAKALPKRFGDVQESLVFEQTSTTLVSLASMTPGATIYIVSPLSYANRGAVVYQRVGSGQPTLIGFISPNVDIEAFSYKHCVLGVATEITIPTVYGGSSSVVSQVQCEAACYEVNPTALTAGQTERAAVSRKAPISVLGENSQALAIVQYAGTEDACMRFNGYDVEAGWVAQGSAPNSVSVVSPTRSSGIELNISAASTGVASWPATGWVSNPQGLNCTPGQTIIWNLNTVAEIARFMIFGDFEIEGQLTTDLKAVTFDWNRWLLDVVVTYIDGTIIAQRVLDVQAASPMAGTAGSNYFKMSTLGISSFMSKRAMPIMNISLRVGNNLGTNLVISGLPDTYLKVKFFEVNPSERFLGYVLSGCTPQQTLQVQFRASIEVFPDSATTTGQVMQATSDMAIDPHMANSVLTMLAAGRFVENPEVLHASTFNEKSLKNFGRKLFDAGKKTVKFYNANQGWINGAAKGLMKLAAATFADGYIDFRSTGMSFPAVSPDGAHEAVLVCKGSGPGSFEFAENFHASKQNYTGTSGGLAFACAVLAESGAPVPKKMYSGEVIELDCDSKNRKAVLVVRPVALADVKIAFYPGLTGLFEAGWHNNGKNVESVKNLFGRHIKVSEEVTLLDSPYPEGSFEATLFLEW